LYTCDVSVRSSCFDVAEAVAKDLGRIDHLVNVVAYFGSQV
jgi:NAD(P)-dependent dehydrogenase (short-subunit alcohol dehydrogenase family)